jgi:hypothetical protein
MTSSAAQGEYETKQLLATRNCYQPRIAMSTDILPVTNYVLFLFLPTGSNFRLQEKKTGQRS